MLNRVDFDSQIFNGSGLERSQSIRRAQTTHTGKAVLPSSPSLSSFKIRLPSDQMIMVLVCGGNKKGDFEFPNDISTSTRTTTINLEVSFSPLLKHHLTSTPFFHPCSPVSPKFRSTYPGKSQASDNPLASQHHHPPQAS